MRSNTRRNVLKAMAMTALGASFPALAQTICGTGVSSPCATPGRLTFAHYMTAGLLSLDNLNPDYYDRNYLNPAGENGLYSAYGGYSRNRPIFRLPLPEATYQILDAQTEVKSAMSVGIDGFAMLMPNTHGIHIDRMDKMWQGANIENPAFLMRMMPDCSNMFGSSQPSPPSQVDFVDLIKRYAAYPNTMKLGDGRYVLSPYMPEIKDTTWWEQVFALLNSQTAFPPIQIAFLPIMGTYNLDLVSMAEVYGFGVWGSRSPGATNPSTSGQLQQAQKAHDDGHLWVQNVALQDVRPTSKIFDEAMGTLTMVNTAQLAVNTSANWVDLDTWNDPAEHSGVYPSRNFGTLALELWRRLGQKWRTGQDWAPDDSLFVMHRPHFKDDLPSWPGYGDITPDPTNPNKPTNLMKPRPIPASQPVDIIDTTSWFKSPTVVTVQANGAVVDTYTAPAGYYRHTTPLAVGTITVSATGSSGVPLVLQAPTSVTHQPVVQDMTYWGAWGVLSAA